MFTLAAFVKKNRRASILSAIFMLGVLLFAILLLVDKRLVGSDDTVFQAQTLPYPAVFDWIAYRYQTWSGRFFSEGFIYIFSSQALVWWQLVTLGMYALFSGTMFAFYRLLGKTSPAKDYVMMILALCLPYLAHKTVLAQGGLWVTGSMVYFWASALGLFALYPVAYFVAKNRMPHWGLTIAGIVTGVVAAGSQEQVGLVMCGLYAATGAYIFFKKRVVPWYVIMFCAAAGLILAISLLAPGNAARMRAETIAVLPDFYTTPLADHIYFGYRWLLEAFINHAGFLLIGIWVSFIALFAKKTTKTWVDYMFMLAFAAACAFSLTNGAEATNYWLNFYASWKPHIPDALNSLNLIPWGIVLGCTVTAPLLLFSKKPFGYLLSILLGAAMVSAIVLLCSPTMYVSLWRSFFVPSMVLAGAFYVLCSRVFETYKQYAFVMIGVIASLAASHYIFQIIRLLQPQP